MEHEKLSDRNTIINRKGERFIMLGDFATEIDAPQFR
jgi:hypothetical protein